MPRDIAARTQPIAPVTRSIKYSLATLDYNMVITRKNTQETRSISTRRSWCVGGWLEGVMPNLRTYISPG